MKRSAVNHSVNTIDLQKTTKVWQRYASQDTDKHNQTSFKNVDELHEKHQRRANLLPELFSGFIDNSIQSVRNQQNKDSIAQFNEPDLSKTKFTMPSSTSAKMSFSHRLNPQSTTQSVVISEKKDYQRAPLMLSTDTSDFLNQQSRNLGLTQSVVIHGGPSTDVLNQDEIQRLTVQRFNLNDSILSTRSAAGEVFEQAMPRSIIESLQSLHLQKRMDQMQSVGPQIKTQKIVGSGIFTNSEVKAQSRLDIALHQNTSLNNIQNQIQQSVQKLQQQQRSPIHQHQKKPPAFRSLTSQEISQQKSQADDFSLYINPPVDQLIKRRIGDSKIGYVTEARVHSFRPEVTKKNEQEYVAKKMSPDWMLKGPSRLMLEIFEINELEKKIRQQQITKKQSITTKDSQSKNQVISFENFSQKFLIDDVQVTKPITPEAQQAYIFKKMKNDQTLLEQEKQILVNSIQTTEAKEDNVDRMSIVEAIKDIQGRDSMLCLWGISPQRLLIKQNTQDWILSRKNQGMKLIESLKDIDLAKEIFKAWDQEDKGYLSMQELSDQLISLGLSTNLQFTEKFLETLTKSGKKLKILTLKKFLKVFEYDKFGQQACELIASEFTQSQQAKFQKIKQKFNRQNAKNFIKTGYLSGHQSENTSVMSSFGETKMQFQHQKTQLHNEKPVFGLSATSLYNIEEEEYLPTKTTKFGSLQPTFQQSSNSNNSSSNPQFKSTNAFKSKEKTMKFKQRLPTLTETIVILKNWFQQAVQRCGSLDTVEIEHTAVADFLVYKGLFNERETGIKYIFKALEIKLDDNSQKIKICYNQFQRLFCRTIFKECLIQVLKDIENYTHNPSISKPLNQQIKWYKRQILINGVKDKADVNLGKSIEPLKTLEPNHGISVIEAQRLQKTNIDKQYFERKTYDEYIADPLSMELRRSKINKNSEIKQNFIEQEILRGRLEKLQHSQLHQSQENR